MRKSMRSGFTLIELMVVVILVMILALAIVPTFKEIIVKAKYTEAASAISALRTKIKVYYVENEVLPGADPAVIAAEDARLALLTNGTPNLISAPVQYMSTVIGSECQLQDDLDIMAGDYSGAYFKDDDYVYVATSIGYKDDSYGYTIAAMGSGEGKSAPVGTGYAVCEIRNSGWVNQPMAVCVFERYKSMPERTAKGPLILDGTTGMAGEAEDPDSIQYILPANWATELASLTTAGAADKTKLKDAGYTLQ